MSRPEDGRDPDRVAVRRDRTRAARHDVVRPLRVGPTASNSGSIAVDRHACCAWGWIPPPRSRPRLAARPVGGSGDRQVSQRSQRSRVDPRDGLIVDVRDPQRPRAKRDRPRAESPPEPHPTTLLLRGSITATEFAGTCTEPAPRAGQLRPPPPRSRRAGRRPPPRSAIRRAACDGRCPLARGAGAREGGSQRGVVGEDRPLELLQARARLEPELARPATCARLR